MPKIKNCLFAVPLPTHFLSTPPPDPTQNFFCTSGKYSFFWPHFHQKITIFPISQQCKKKNMQKKMFPTNLPNQKIQGRGTANKHFFKDGPSITPMFPFRFVKVVLIHIQPGAVARSEASSLGMQAAPSSIPTSGTFFRGDLVMKAFLRPFSLFRWFKKSNCQLLAKECALSTGKLPRRLAQEQCG